jgi:hypothetical protein
MGDTGSDERPALVGTRWVHVDGDDDARGAVFRDAKSDLPLSRRPKEFLEFSGDGIVRLLATGPDDRAHEVDRTTWSDKGGNVVFRFDTPDARGASEYQVVESAPDRLVIRRK